MREVLAMLRQRAPALHVDGEMHGDLALDARLRKDACSDSTFDGDANLLVMPNVDAANISYNLLKAAAAGNVSIGPLLLGVGKPVQVLSETATVRGVVNATAILVAGLASA
jgi:malate dehydrogenase (oxaloacetate-decarboxylating)(NADP+)